MTTVHLEDHVGGVRLLTLDRPSANAIEEMAKAGAELVASALV